MKSIFKSLVPLFIKNSLFKIYLISIKFFFKYTSSQKFWSKNIVDCPKNGFENIENSLNHLAWRNNQYIDSINHFKMNQLNNKIVLDYGCGPGNDIINIYQSSKPKKLIGVDVSDQALILAKKRVDLHKIKVDLIKINEEEKIVAIDNDSIDIIQSNGVLHHIANLKFVFSEFSRILKENGTVRVMIYNKNSIWYHLHVAFEMKIKKKVFTDLTLDELFSKTTDGFDCPISKCYQPEEFINICKKNRFKGKLIGVSISLFEMSKIPLMWEAQKSKFLESNSIEFLKNIEFDKRGIPYYKKVVAGVNSYFELTKLR
tara:strand:+ start:872 stop:1816 length:945 start_codon:yes stop_codon:yes gene_type:complete